VRDEREVGISILLYSGRTSSVGNKLERSFKSQSPNNKIETCRTVSNLYRRLHHPLLHVGICDSTSLVMDLKEMDHEEAKGHVDQPGSREGGDPKASTKHNPEQQG
jgi:hypothetical protein